MAGMFDDLIPELQRGQQEIPQQIIPEQQGQTVDERISAERVSDPGMFQDLVPQPIEARGGEAPQEASFALPTFIAGEVADRATILPLGRTKEDELTLAAPQFIKGPFETVKGILSGEKENISPAEILELGALLAPGAGGAAKLPFPRPIPRTAPAAPTLAEGAEVAAAAQRLGVDLPRAVTTDVTAVQQIGKIATSVPVGGTPLIKASQAAIEQLGTVAGDVQASLGSGVVELAGAQARAGLENQITQRSVRRVAERYNKVDALVDNRITAPLSNTASEVGKITARRKQAAISGKGKAGQLVDEALNRPEGLNYQGTKDLRTSIGQMLDNPSALPSDLPKAELKRIYGSLTRDLKFIVAQSGGNKASAAFNSANNFAARQAVINKALNEVLKTKSNEGVFEKVITAAGTTKSANISLLKKARGAVDNKTWDDISSAVISRLGRDKDGNFSPDRFLTSWGKLTKNGKRILFQTTGRGEIASSLNDIAIVSRRFKKLQQFANPSGTGQTVAGIGSLTGLFFSPLETIGSIAGARVLSSILAKPASAKSTAKWAKEYVKVVSKGGSAEALSRASLVLAVQIADEMGEPERAESISQDLLNSASASFVPPGGSRKATNAQGVVIHQLPNGNFVDATGAPFQGAPGGEGP